MNLLILQLKHLQKKEKKKTFESLFCVYCFLL